MITQQGISKYKGTIIVTFLLLTCIVVSMFANVYLANKISTTSFLIAKTSNQKTIIQRISKALLRIRSQRNTGRNYELDVSELIYGYEQFNNTLHKLSKGGILENESNSKIKIDKITNKQGLDIFKRALLLWTDIKLSMSPLNETSKQVSDTKLRAITDIVNAHSVQIMNIMDDLTVFYQQENEKNTKLLYISYLATAVLSITLILFLLIKVLMKHPIKTRASSLKTDDNIEQQTILVKFLANTETNLQAVTLSLQSLLKDTLPTDTVDASELNKIVQPINNIKQNAATIDCIAIEKIAASLLNEIELLQHDKIQLTNNSLEAMHNKLGQLNAHYQLLTKLINEEEAMQNEIQPIKQTKDNNLSPTQYADWLKLKKLATTIAEQQNKKVELHLHGLQTELPENYHKGLIDISKQLLRNSITHGIESTAIRQSALKPEFGQITITLKPTAEEGYEFIYEDDGQGINYEEIRKTVVEKGFASQEAADKLDKNQLATYIFKLGFSTLKDTNIDNKGGIGMDIIKHVIDKLGGKTILLSVVNKNTRFTVILPTLHKEQRENSYLNTA